MLTPFKLDPSSQLLAAKEPPPPPTREEVVRAMKEAEVEQVED